MTRRPRPSYGLVSFGYIAQRIHLRLLDEVLPDPSRGISLRHGRRLGDFRFGAYVDDYFSLGHDFETAATHLDRVVQQCLRAGVPANDRKVIPPGADSVVILGIEAHSNGCLLPRLDRFQALLSQIRTLASRRLWPLDALRHLLGKWAWNLLLRRPIFSVLFSCYKLIHLTDSVVSPPHDASQELLTLVRIAPLVRADLTQDFLDVVLCTDASTKGGGVVYAHTLPSEVLPLVESDDVSFHVNWIKQQEWRVAIRHGWRQAAHVNILEGEAIVLGLRWLLRTLRHRDHRILVFVDNQAVLGALRKGRSSSPTLNRICRKVAAYVWRVI